jgi:hypothetical protein
MFQGAFRFLVKINVHFSFATEKIFCGKNGRYIGEENKSINVES